MSVTAIYNRERLRRAPKMRSIRVRDMTVTYIPDGVGGLRPRGWLPDTTDADWRTYAEYLNEDGHLVIGVGALLVQKGSSALLIDAGVGPVDLPSDPANPLSGAMRGGQLLTNLALTGVSPDELDAVAITHPHFDHLGWLFQPGFAARRYLISQTEWQWWRNFGPEERAQYPEWAQRLFITEEMLDYLEPKIETVADGAEILPGIQLDLISGHTHGHASYILNYGDERMVVLGDALHSPLQVSHPLWACGADLDQSEGKIHRRQVVDELADSGGLAVGMHFADVVFGRVHRDGTGGTEWIPFR